jgi:hypothetical protein
MSIMRLDLPAVHIPGGSMAPGPDGLTLEMIGTYSAKLQRGEITEDKFKEYLNLQKINYDYFKNNVGSVIVSHTGPSVYGIILFKGGKYIDE